MVHHTHQVAVVVAELEKLKLRTAAAVQSFLKGGLARFLPIRKLCGMLKTITYTHDSWIFRNRLSDWFGNGILLDF